MTLRLATLCVLLLPAVASAQVVRASRAADHRDNLDDRVMLVFHEQRIGDAERAQLIAFVTTAVPVERWRTVPVSAATTLTVIVDTYYDLYDRPGDRFSRPSSVIVMIDAIQRANPGVTSSVAANTRLRLPPFPVRAKGQFDSDVGQEAFRVFDTDTWGYSLNQGVGSATLSNLPLIANAKTLDPQRDASVTGIVLDITPEMLKPGLSSIALPPSVLTFSAHPATPTGERVEFGTAKVSLLTESLRAQCASAFAALNGSPFRSRQKGVIKALSQADRDRLSALAMEIPLAVIDVGFTSGHGSRVRHVIRGMLTELGVPELDAHVEEFELLPLNSKAQKALEDTLATYLAGKPNATDDQVTLAKDWIRRARETATENTREIVIDETVLQAVFWKYFTSATWLNMSFRTDSGALRTLMSRLQLRKAMSFAAAGNDNVELKPGWVPQDGALGSHLFLIVTFGDDQGRVDGDYTNEAGRPPVSLVAPGCGFDGISETGSSLASPYVAAAVWTRFLLDAVISGTQPEVDNVLGDVLLASRPVPGQPVSISTGGFFDAALLFATPSAPHLLRRGREVEVVEEFQLAVSCADGSSRKFPFDGPPRRFTVTIHETPKGMSLWTRELTEKGTLQIDRRCTIKELTFSARTDMGAPIKMAAPQFVKEVLHLTW